MNLFVDADACPVKDEIYRVAARYRVPVTLVANTRLWVPVDPDIELVVVRDGLDAADDWIVERVRALDVVVTADVRLAGRCVEKGARVLSPTGRPFTEDNVADAVATRDLLTELRSAGERTSGPRPLEKRDRSRFLQELDVTIQGARRAAARSPR